MIPPRRRQLRPAWLNREELGVTEAEIREYFALNAAVTGALALASELLGLKLEPTEAAGRLEQAAQRRVFHVTELDGAPLGLLELDAFGLDDAAGEEQVLLEATDRALPLARIQCGFERSLDGLDGVTALEVDLAPRSQAKRTVEIDYHGAPRQGITFRREAREVWTAFSTSQWMPCLDAPSVRASFELQLTLPRGLEQSTFSIQKETRP